jgi:diguanylate cyclase (GGDEF)-like protein/PAS domain S-box-containing protein
MLGMAEPELIGATLSSFLSSRAAELVNDRLDLLRTGTQRAFSRECQARGRLGRPLWLALSVALVSNSDGNPLFFSITIRDISGAKQLEKMLLDSDRRFRTIFNALSEGFVETSTDGKIVDVNHPMCRMLGFGRQELIGRSIHQFLDANSRALVMARMNPQASIRRDRKAITSGQTKQKALGLPTAFEAMLATKDGTPLDVQVFATVLTDDTGAPSGATAIVLDVTERNAAQQALRISEQRNRTLVESIQDGLIMVCDGRFQYVNSPFAEMLGFTPGDLVGRPVSLVCPPGGNADQESATILANGESEITFITHWGTHLLGHVTCATTRTEMGAALQIATVKDVTEQRRIEQDLRKLSSAVEHSPASVFITDTKGRIEYVNPSFTQVTGYSPEEACGHTPALLKSGQTPPATYQDMWKHLANGQTWRGEFRNRRKDGSLYWEFTSISPIRNESGTVSHFVAVKEDITPRKEAELQNWRQANFDQVTGLPNRVLFKDRLQQALSRAQRDAKPVAVMFIDLDHFKAVNDTLGHEAGDTVLQHVGQRLTDCVRGTDTIARLAGDEFTAILPDPGPGKHITAVAQRILDSLRSPFVMADGQEAYIGGSIGIAIYPEDGADAVSLLRSADHAMYRAKESGRNTYQFFTADMNRVVEERIQLEMDLRKALHERQFAVHFQPMVDAASRTIHGAEALVRWAHPVRGMVPPSEFLPVAEDIGLIGELGSFVLRRACTQCALWRDSGYPDMTVSVNISGRQIIAPNFLEIIDDALSFAALPAQALELEVAETLLLSDAPLVEATLRAVADRGVTLTIDDFGTGYSSVQHLRRFPFSTLKVDRSFVHNVLTNHEDAILVEAVIAMARKLGLRVLAEGVETQSQIDYLLTQYCDMFQGFLFGKPLPADEFNALLAACRGRRLADDLA